MQLRFRTCIALLGMAMLATAAHAAIVAQSTSVTGQLQYQGFGDVGGGVGSGRYTLGNCVFDGTTTTCSLTGNYLETPQSTHTPGLGGTYAMQLRYPGSGPSPVVAQSIAPGSSVLALAALGSATFTAYLFPASGGVITGTFPAPVVADSLGFAAFLDPIGLACTGLASAQNCDIGQVGLVAGATITGGVKPLVVSIPQASGPATRNYQGLWWASPAGMESGWGINFAHQDNTIFATWFTYDANGKAWWLSMTAVRTGQDTYGGTLYETKGPPFNAVPFDPQAVTLRDVGAATLLFTSATTAVFTYTVNGVAQTKTITQQIFGSAPTCVWGAQPDLAKATNQQDLWWAVPAGSESGWGINFTHQGTTIFATWFTYGVDRNPVWYSMTAPQTAPLTFSGTLYRTTGPAFNAVPFDPRNVQLTAVGSATLKFTDGNAGTFTYEVNDGANVASQIKPITRQVFAAPGTVCN